VEAIVQLNSKRGEVICCGSSDHQFGNVKKDNDKLLFENHKKNFIFKCSTPLIATRGIERNYFIYH